MNAHEIFGIAPDEIKSAVCDDSPGLTDLERNIIIVAHYVSVVSYEGLISFVLQVNNVSDREIKVCLCWWLISRRTK